MNNKEIQKSNTQQELHPLSDGEQQAIAGQEETFDEFGGILNEFVPSAINSLLSVSVGAASQRRYRFLVRRGGSPAISIQSSVGLIRVN